MAQTQSPGKHVWLLGPVVFSLLIVLMLVLSACGTPLPQQNANSRPALPVSEPVEDCDLDDMFEGDEDCYGKAKPTKKPSDKAKATKKPAAKATSKPSSRKK